MQLSWYDKASIFTYFFVEHLKLDCAFNDGFFFSVELSRAAVSAFPQKWMKLNQWKLEYFICLDNQTLKVLLPMHSKVLVDFSEKNCVHFGKYSLMLFLAIFFSFLLHWEKKKSQAKIMELYIMRYLHINLAKFYIKNILWITCTSVVT